jgi:hypothetical protein
VGHRTPTAAMGRPITTRAGSRRRRLLCSAGALLVCALVPASANAANLATFSVTREASNPALTQAVLTPLGVPSAVAAKAIFSAPGNFRFGNTGAFVLDGNGPSPTVTCTASPSCPNNDPVLSPSLHVNTTFSTPATNPITEVVLHLPGGQLGNPLASTLCRGAVATSPTNPGNNTCTNGQVVGTTSIHSPALGGVTLSGKIYNLDPATTATSPFADQNIPTAPAALAFVLSTCNAAGGAAVCNAVLPNPNIQLVPLTLRPRFDGEDYGLDSALHFNPALPVDSASLTLFGLVSSDTAQTLAARGVLPAPFLPFTFNPTSCLDQTATLDVTRNDGTVDPTGPGQSKLPAGNRTDGAGNFLGHGSIGCNNSLWNGNELATDATVQAGHAAVGQSKINTNLKLGTSRSSLPDSYEVSFFTPTDAGLPYQSHVKEISAILPNGTAFSTALANKPGFTACTDAQFDRGAPEAANCPAGSRIGDLKALTPLLDQVRSTNANDEERQAEAILTGCTQFAAQPENPCGNLSNPATIVIDPATGNPVPLGAGATLDPIGGDVWAGPQVPGHPNQFKVFTELTDGGVTRIKSVGIATADEKTGQITATFDDLPQSPFYHLTQFFDGGDHAALVNPIDCGEHVMNTELHSWLEVLQGAAQPSLNNPAGAFGGTPPSAEPDAKININDCGNASQFTPDLSFLADPFTAGQDTKFTTTIKKPDRQKNLVGTDVSLPDDVVGALSSVPLCTRAQVADNGNCPADSQIGTVETVVGNGGDPLHQTGKVYLSEPVTNAADDRPELARITTVVRAAVGPFDLGTVVNELALKLRQSDGHIGVDNLGVDKLPTIMAGIPIRIRQLNLTIDRAGFIRNPLTCDARSGSGSFTAEDGTVVNVTAPFQATGCDNLPFAPKLSATAGSDAAPALVGHHPSFTTTVSLPDHNAAIKKSVVTLPDGLLSNPSALSTLCSHAQLDANSCPAASKVGNAKADSPLLPAPLTGPMYLVANPAGGLPQLVVKLTGFINQTLTATTSISGTRLVTTFDGLPALAVTSFTLNVDGGPNGLFTVGNALCGGPNIDGSFDSHTGQHATDSSPVKVNGNCVPVPAPQSRSASTRKPSFTVSVRRLRSAPIVTLKARTVRNATRIRTVRLALPSRLVVKRGVKNGVSVFAGGKKLSRGAWTLSRSGVLTIRIPRKGSSAITASIKAGTLRTSAALHRLAAGRKTLSRLTFTGRLVDLNKQRFNYTVRARPSR